MASVQTQLAWRHEGALDAVARAAMGMRAFAYLVLGLLGVVGALSASPGEGLLTWLASPGTLTAALMWPAAAALLVVGLWRAGEAVANVYGPFPGGRNSAKRVEIGASGLVHALLGFWLLGLAAGARSARDWVASSLEGELGPWLVMAVGLAVLFAGLYEVLSGLSRHFEDQLRLGEMSRAERVWARRVGTLGIVARGLVLLAAGGAVFGVGLVFQPGDGTLGAVVAGVGSREWVFLGGLGLIAYGVHMAFMVRFRQVMPR